MPSPASQLLASAVIAATAADAPANALDTLATAYDAWKGGTITYQEFANQISEFIANQKGREAELRAWMLGTVNGGTGPDGTGVGGYYPLHYVGGGVIYLPSPAYMLSVTAKGEQGFDARTDVGFGYGFNIVPTEVISANPAVDGMIINPAKCAAVFLNGVGVPTALTAAFVSPIRLNGVTQVGTMSGAVGATKATFAFTNRVVPNDGVLSIVGVANMPVALTGTFAGGGVA